ncbi:hypothetical protein M8C21_012115, partial [Ambrosia artemisiifolia]
LCVLVVDNSGFLFLSNGGITSSFVRNAERSIDMPFDSDVFRVPPGYNAPQQVHITQGDHEGKAVIVSWVTMDEPGSSTVLYWPQDGSQKDQATGHITTYKYYNYTSGYIHHCTLHNLEFNTKYYYEVGIDHTIRTFWFVTPPALGPDVPYTFGIIGDLGQTYDSNITLTHYEMNPVKGESVLYVGDLSYADDYPYHDNRRWDSWARFVERSVAYQPWIWTAGNHELDYEPNIGENKPFKPFLHRYHVPFNSSGSTEPLWYSIKRASAYIIVLSSYSAYGTYTPQYMWLMEELPKVNRSETPWLIVLMHSPIRDARDEMAVGGGGWVLESVSGFKRESGGGDGGWNRISNIAYNIVNGKCTPVFDQNAPVYITIGDGGNIEGLATVMTEPQPNYSAFREASFGHATMEIKNRTRAYYSWHRNSDGYAVKSDSVVFFNRYWYPKNDSTVET